MAKIQNEKKSRSGTTHEREGITATEQWLGSRIHSCATPFQSRRAPVRVVLSGRWPVPLVGSRLESRSAALGGFSATTTSTIKHRCAVSRSVFV